MGGGRKQQYIPLSLSDLAWSFGTSDEKSIADCMKFLNIKESDLTYRILIDEEKDNEILNAIKRIENDMQIVATPERTQVWQNGWAENLKDFIESNYNLDSLTSKYFRENAPMRFKQQFIKSENPHFESDFWRILRTWIFKTYFPQYDTIYEFGCGTGQNLVTLAKMYPAKKIWGLDFVNSSTELVNLIHEKCNLNIQGKLFNMIQPDYNFKLEAGSAVFTAHSIEQLGNQYQNLVDYLLKNEIAFCINVEPMAELYDQNNLIDYLAYTFHTKRHYPSGYIPLLRELEQQGKLTIIKIQRCYFGNLNHEGFNLIIWKPV